MSRKRNHRMQERRISFNPMHTATVNATRFTDAEIATQMAPILTLARAFREGVASEDQFHALRTCMAVSLAIEGTGIVRGLQAHFLAAVAALDAAATRARVMPGTWRPTTLTFDELDAITEAVWLHEEQLRVLSCGEWTRIIQRLTDQARTKGEATVVIRTAPAAHPASTIQQFSGQAAQPV